MPQEASASLPHWKGSPAALRRDSSFLGPILPAWTLHVPPHCGELYVMGQVSPGPSPPRRCTAQLCPPLWSQGSPLRLKAHVPNPNRAHSCNFTPSPAPLILLKASFGLVHPKSREQGTATVATSLPLALCRPGPPWGCEAVPQRLQGQIAWGQQLEPALPGSGLGRGLRASWPLGQLPPTSWAAHCRALKGPGRPHFRWLRWFPPQPPGLPCLPLWPEAQPSLHLHLWSPKMCKSSESQNPDPSLAVLPTAPSSVFGFRTP